QYSRSSGSDPLYGKMATVSEVSSAARSRIVPAICWRRSSCSETALSSGRSSSLEEGMRKVRSMFAQRVTERKHRTRCGAEPHVEFVQPHETACRRRAILLNCYVPSEKRSGFMGHLHARSSGPCVLGARQADAR